MYISDKLIKPVIEAKYLTVENADRYRSIIRLFYLQYEKLKYWMYQEEVFEELKEDDYFADYTLEQCQQDLASLVQWKNLVTLQDTRKVTTIEEFKNKKFRYQLSEYSVEIERMVIHLENLYIEGASLEPTLLERIRNTIEKTGKISEEDNEHIYSWWNDLNNDFARLNQNYQDYMRELNSVKAEELMRTSQFLVFKDRLTDYLRSFVKGLQSNLTFIEQYMSKLSENYVFNILEHVVQYEMSIPRMDVEIDEEKIREKIQGRWKNIKEWFMGNGSDESEAYKVFDATNEIIRRITRYATRISELTNSGANRREEYYKLACMFSKCSSIDEAHCLSAYVFGIEAPFHLKGDFVRDTESINSGVYEEKPAFVEITPRIRAFREKSKRSAIIDKSAEKERMRLETIKRLEEERKLFESYIKDDYLDFDKLTVLEPHVRNVFLTWLSKAFENKDYKGKTEEGRGFYIENANETKRCVIESEDGVFEMPAYRIRFN